MLKRKTLAWSPAARPATAEEGDCFVDLSRDKIYVFTNGRWECENAPEPTTEVGGDTVEPEQPKEAEAKPKKKKTASKKAKE